MCQLRNGLINFKNIKIMNKKIIFLLILISFNSNFSNSQSIKMDTLLGSKGLFSKFKPKVISANQKLSFNIRMVYTMTDKSGKKREVCTYMNTKHGYVGVLNVQNGDYSFNPNSANFKLMVYSNSMQFFVYNSNKKGKKSVMSMPTGGNNDFKMDNVSIKKENGGPKKFTNLKINGFGYNNSKTTAKDKVVMYLTDDNASGKYESKNQLSYAGIGFYQLNNKTVLNLSIEKEGVSIILNKIEAVDVSLNGSDFKKEESGVSEEMMQEMMKKLKKQ
jgi:hypothetical protein